MDYLVNDKALCLLVMEAKLYVNKKLYKKDAITKEMYEKAIEIILKNYEAIKR